MPRDSEPQANFPIFMKLIAVFIVFGILPLVGISLAFLWDYASALKTVGGLIEENPDQVQEKIQEIQHVFRIKMGFLFILFLILMSAGILFSARILVRPLSRLLSGVRLLIKGEYGAEITVKSNDEYAMFADYFNEMSHQLKTMI